MKTINYLFNVEKFVKNVALFVQSLNKYLQHKNEKFTGLKNGIRSLFISIRFKIDQRVHDRQNFLVTKFRVSRLVFSKQLTNFLIAFLCG
jgi:hypothetical protein